MNFIDGLILNDNGLLFKSKDDLLTIRLPHSYQNSLKNYINSEVKIGIRPEDILLEPGNALFVYNFSTQIEVAEQMGNETFLYFNLGNAPFVGRVRSIEKPDYGTLLNLFFNLGKLYFFSKESVAI